MISNKEFISLGKEYDYIQFLYIDGIKYYNSDYAGTDNDEIILLGEGK